MAIKKAFQPLVNLLESNKDKKVSAILDQVTALASAKSGGGGESNFIKDAKGVVTHIFCYYHKKWEPVHADGHGDAPVPGKPGTGHCEYGKKANTPTGLNTMCKIGTSMWTKQQREAKNASVKMLDDVQSGALKPTGIKAEQEKIEKARAVIVLREDKLGSEKKPA